MGQFIRPLLLLLTVAATPSFAQGLADFSRFSGEINKQIALVEADGTVREGVLVAAGPDSVTMKFVSGTRSFASGQIASAERMRDGRSDGFLKGAIFGALVGLSVLGVDGTSSDRLAGFVGSVAFYGGIGYAFDAAQTHRETIYRLPAASTPAPTASMKLSFRF